MPNNEKLLRRSVDLLSVASETPFGDNMAEKFKACNAALGICDDWLKEMGASTELMTFEGGHEKWPYAVPNLYAEIDIGAKGAKSDYAVYMGHIDVVPPGDLQQWQSAPFNASERDGYLYARGATDMKANITAFIAALEEQTKSGRGGLRVGLIITGDEEWAAVNGSRRVLEWLRAKGKEPTKFIVGEPSSPDVLGTHIKVGRRGSLVGNITIAGTQGHRAYKDLYSNPNLLYQFVNIALSSMRWQDGNKFMPPTDLEISAVNAGNFAASAIIPDKLEAMYSIRYTDKRDKHELFASVKERIENIPEYLHFHPDFIYYSQHLNDIKITANFDTASIPYYSTPETLAKAAAAAVESELHIKPQFDAAGGTTDGRFVHQYFPQAEIIELGLPEKGGMTGGKKPEDYGRAGGMHQYNERASLDDIFNLSAVYSRLLQNLRNDNANNHRAGARPRFG